MASAISRIFLESVPKTAKVADLDRNTINSESITGPCLTTDHGVKASDTDNWLKVSQVKAGHDTSGPSLLEDQISREKLHRFDHERIPERVVHARGTGAHGYFTVFDKRAEKYTIAPVLNDPSRTTSVFVRFSTVQGSKGSADTVRDVRGFAVKFYTKEGNWDLVGNNIPVFFIQDAIKFPDVIHAVKPEPHNEIPQGQSAHNNFWDFVGLQPETAHMVMWAMSDRAIPRSYRMMQGFGVNTYTLVNAQGERVFVKFHLIPELGVNSLAWDEVLKLNGQDPDYHRKDLNEAIESGCYPKWTLAIQTISETDEDKFEFDILDATKVWPEELVPLLPVGELILNRIVEEFFPEVEQAAFCTSHVVPGIGFSDDPLLQGRNFSYFDTQITRLGINWEQLPINRPVCPVMNHHRDGKMQHRIVKGQINYWPNRRGTIAPVHSEKGGYAEYAEKIAGIKNRVRSTKFQEHFNQAQMFYNSLTPIEQLHLSSAFKFELSHCDDPVVYKQYIHILNNIDRHLTEEVATSVGGDFPEEEGRPNRGIRSEALSQMYYMPKSPTIASRRIAVLLADGFNLKDVLAVQAAITSARGVCYMIGPRRDRVYPEEEIGMLAKEGLNTDHHWEGQRSTMFDALFIPSGLKHAKALANNGRTVHWIREAFGHCKVIGAIGEGVSVVAESLDLDQIDYEMKLDDDNVKTSYGIVTTGKYGLVSAAHDAIKIETGNTAFVSNFAFQLSKHRCWERELIGLTSKVAY